MTEYSERELIIPALDFIRANPQGVTTTEMIDHLIGILNPTGYDMTILNGRNDTHFSQKVRNLKSHNTLEDADLVNYQRIANNGFWTITPAGIQYLRSRGY